MRLILEAPGAAVTADFTEEVIAEVVREELFAAVTLPRGVLHRRVIARTDLSVERIRPVTERLSAIGDLTEGAGGILASAPVRVVDRGVGCGYWLGTTPRRWLARRVPEVRLEDGWPRGVVVDASLQRAVEQLGGVLLSVQRWAGVEEAIPATAWLSEMVERLERAHPINGSLVPDGARPAHLQPEVGWREGVPQQDRPVLIRWTEFGYLRWGVTLGSRLVSLTPDEARRGTLALKLHAAHPVTYRIERSNDRAIVSTDAWLPSAEWRLLIGLSTTVRRERRVVAAEISPHVEVELIAALQRAGLREAS